MVSAGASTAICVQRFDDSRNSAIHTTYRISLRSSSLREPRYPLFRVISIQSAGRACRNSSGQRLVVGGKKTPDVAEASGRIFFSARVRALNQGVLSLEGLEGLESWARRDRVHMSGLIGFNDPSAGSPTETLLRLLLPLNGRVQRNSRSNGQETCPEFQS